MSIESQLPKSFEKPGSWKPDTSAPSFDFISIMKHAKPLKDGLVQDDKKIKGSRPDTFEKMSPEAQAKEAKVLAKEIAEKGFKDHRDLRDKLRSDMLRVYMDGDASGRGDQKALDAFIKQINDNLPKGMSLKIAQPKDDPDYKKFMKGAEENIANQGQILGTHGQIQLWKTEGGKGKLVDKTHFAAGLQKNPTEQI